MIFYRMEAKRGNIVFAIGKGKCFMKRKTICFLAAFGAILGGSMLFGGTASAEEAEVTDVPVATEVTEVTVPAVENSGWQDEDGVRRYYDESGNFLTGEQEIDGAYYLFDYDGVQKTGWRTVNGVRRYYDPETGNIVSGWVDYCDYRYYTDADTGKKTGELQDGEERYLLDAETGQQQLGLCTFSDHTVSYYDANGKPVSGWVKDKGKTYHFNSKHLMQTGWQDFGGKRYYFASSGVMQTGWQELSGAKYYFDSDVRCTRDFCGWTIVHTI